MQARTYLVVVAFLRKFPSLIRLTRATARFAQKRQGPSMNVPAPPTWSLHPQLAADTSNIGDLPLARVLPINDANYPWLVLVPRRLDVAEIIDLGGEDQEILWREIALLPRVRKP